VPTATLESAKDYMPIATQKYKEYDWNMVTWQVKLYHVRFMFPFLIVAGHDPSV